MELILTQLRDLTHVIFVFSTSPRVWLCPTSRDRSIWDCHHNWKHFSSWRAIWSPGTAMAITTAEQRAAAIPLRSLSQLHRQPAPAAPSRWPWQPALSDLRRDSSSGSERAKSGNNNCFLDAHKRRQATLGQQECFQAAKPGGEHPREARCEGSQYLSRGLGWASSARWAWSTIPGLLQKTASLN